MKALEESASGDEATTKHLSISRTTYIKSLKTDKVGQILSKRLKHLWRHTKREMRTCTRSNVTDDRLSSQNLVFASAIHSHWMTVISYRQNTNIIQIKVKIDNASFFRNLDVSCILGIHNPLHPYGLNFPSHGFTVRVIFQEQNHRERRRFPVCVSCCSVWNRGIRTPV